MKPVTQLIAAAAMVALFAGPALAQKVSIDQAKKIAADNGMTTVTEIEYDDGKWEIEGRDASNREIEIDLNGDTGAVVKLERDKRR